MDNITNSEYHSWINQDYPCLYVNNIIGIRYNIPECDYLVNISRKKNKLFVFFNDNNSMRTNTFSLQKNKLKDEIKNKKVYQNLFYNKNKAIYDSKKSLTYTKIINVTFRLHILNPNSDKLIDYLDSKKLNNNEQIDNNLNEYYMLNNSNYRETLMRDKIEIMLLLKLNTYHHPTETKEIKYNISLEQLKVFLLLHRILLYENNNFIADHDTINTRTYEGQNFAIYRYGIKIIPKDIACVIELNKLYKNERKLYCINTYLPLTNYTTKLLTDQIVFLEKSFNKKIIKIIYVINYIFNKLNYSSYHKNIIYHKLFKL